MDRKKLKEQKQNEIDLEDLKLIMEGFVAKFSKMPEADKVDLAARLKPIEKSCLAIDKEMKAYVKTKLKHKEGTLLGTLFKAVLKLVPTKRLNQSALKENEPEIHEEYNEDVTDERVTFELR